MTKEELFKLSGIQYLPSFDEMDYAVPQREDGTYPDGVMVYSKGEVFGRIICIRDLAGMAIALGEWHAYQLGDLLSIYKGKVEDAILEFERHVNDVMRSELFHKVDFIDAVLETLKEYENPNKRAIESDGGCHYYLMDDGYIKKCAAGRICLLPENIPHGSWGRLAGVFDVISKEDHKLKPRYSQLTDDEIALLQIIHDRLLDPDGSLYHDEELWSYISTGDLDAANGMIL